MAALLPVAGCDGSEPAEFTGEAAWRYLIAQCDLGPRPPASPAHRQSIRLIAKHLEAQGAVVSFQRFELADPYSDRTLELINIIGSFSPEESKRVLLAAHYDTRPWADQEEVDSLRQQPILGANDGASGVAVLLELADIVGEHPPEGTGVDLVFFDGEDYGKAEDLDHFLLGSKYFAANLGGYRPQWGILLDMVGGAGARIHQEANSLAKEPELTRALFARAEALGLDVFVAQRGQPVYDDHIPLLMAGIPIVDLIEFPYRYWHTLDDTPDKCSKETLRQVGTLVADFLYNR
ncbi:MAG: M28 family peptidase [Candidatus Latescibacterota bacterium]|nr:MAG: M28 family peptidase [Candidatus Latescibacterota bacterium]